MVISRDGRETRPAEEWAIFDDKNERALPGTTRRTRSVAIEEYVEGTGMTWAQHKRNGVSVRRVLVVEREAILPPGTKVVME